MLLHDTTAKRVALALALLSDPPRAVDTEPLLAMLCAEARTADELRAAAVAGMRVAHFDVAAEALAAIPEGERTKQDAFALAHHLYQAGDAVRALAVHRTVAVPDEGHPRGVWLVNEVIYALEARAAVAP